MTADNVISQFANAGLPGNPSRFSTALLIEPRFMNPLKPVLKFGDPCKLVAGLLEAIESGDLASVFYGILTRQAPSIQGNTSSAFNTGTPNADYEQGVCRKGYINVTCAVGTPVANGQAYMRTVVDSGKALGDIEFTKDASVAGGLITGTGTGTLAITEDGTAVPGTYSIVLQETSSTAEFFLFDPNGALIGKGNVGTELVVNGLTMTITDGGTMTAGDSFAPVVTDANVAMKDVTFAVAAVDDNNVSEAYIG